MLEKEFQLIKPFLFNPSKELYGREIERMAGTTHERNIVYLNKLVKTKIFFKERRGKQIFYKLNKQNELIIKALSLAELERKIKFAKNNEISFLIVDIISKVLAEFQTSIYFILLFGSTARKHHKKQSDIDLLFALVKNGKTEKKIREIIKKIETITNYKISPHIITIDEMEKRWKKEPVYKNIWEERIVFFGEENFWRFVLKEGEPL